MKIKPPILHRIEEGIDSSYSKKFDSAKKQIIAWLESIGIDTEFHIRNIKVTYNHCYHLYDVEFRKNNITVEGTNTTVYDRRWAWDHVRDLMIENESNLEHLNLHGWEWEFYRPNGEVYDEELLNPKQPTPSFRFWIKTKSPLEIENSNDKYVTVVDNGIRYKIRWGLYKTKDLLTKNQLLVHSDCAYNEHEFIKDRCVGHERLNLLLNYYEITPKEYMLFNNKIKKALINSFPQKV